MRIQRGGAMMLHLALTLALSPLAWAPVADAAPCTPGVNCYCDRVRSGDLKDPTLLLCEDFEAPTLQHSQNDAAFVGKGAPYWGPPYDHSNTGSHVCFRGGNGYWHRNYNTGTGGPWRAGQPPPPVTVGCSCSVGPGQTCGSQFWHPTNLYQGNGQANIAILTDQDFAAEVPTIAAPANRAGGGRGAFDGAASLGHRILPRQTGGNGSNKGFGSPQRNIGITMAVAYPNNLVASGVVSNPWKHNEWGTGIGDGPFMFHTANWMTSTFPWKGFMFTAGANRLATCQAAVAGATWAKGKPSCSDVALAFDAAPADYVQATHWPLGTWGCARGHFQNLGLANTRYEAWITGPDGVERKVFDVSNLDTRSFRVGLAGGYDRYIWNSYANKNMKQSTTQTTFRYEDNVHIRADAPVSCAQIGYGTTGALTPIRDTTPFTPLTLLQMGLDAFGWLLTGGALHG